MCLSEIYLILLAIFAKYKSLKMESAQKLLSISLLCLVFDNSFHFNLPFAIYKSEDIFIKFGILFAGICLSLLCNSIKQQLMIILIEIGAILALSANDIIFLLFAIEFMIFPTYFFDDNEKLYTKYNLLAGAIFVFSVGITSELTVSNFTDIRYLCSFMNPNSMIILFITCFLMLSFLIRCNGVLGCCYKNKSIMFLAPIFCIIIPITSLIIFRLISNVFCYASISDVLIVIAFISICYAGIAIYKSEKINELLSNCVVYNSGIVLLCCAVKSEEASQCMIYLVLSEIFTMLGFVVFLSVIRKKKNMEYINDLTSLGYRFRLLGLSISILLLMMATFPPSMGFFDKLYAYQCCIENNYICTLIALGITSVLVLICFAKVIIRIWRVDDMAFFAILNQKLVYLVYLTIIMNIVCLPIVYSSIDFFRSGFYFETQNS